MTFRTNQIPPLSPIAKRRRLHDDVNLERAAIAAGLRSDLSEEERERALKIGRLSYRSAGAKRER